MPNNLNRENIWNGHVLKSLDDGVRTAVGAIRVAQKVFPTTQLADVTSVPADIFHPDEMQIEALDYAAKARQECGLPLVNVA